jgi:hypothetical protein
MIVPYHSATLSGRSGRQRAALRAEAVRIDASPLRAVEEGTHKNG